MVVIDLRRDCIIEFQPLLVAILDQANGTSYKIMINRQKASRDQ